MPFWITDPFINRLVTTAVQVALIVASVGPIAISIYYDHRGGHRR